MSADINEHYNKIYRYCFFKVKNAGLAEDLTQETFYKYFSQSSYIERGKPLAYLYTIAKNLCSDTFRQKQAEELDEEAVGKDSIGQADLSITIRQALGTLPNLECELLLLRYVNELSVGEIAHITQLSRFAVYRKTTAALAKLKCIIREEDFA